MLTRTSVAACSSQQIKTAEGMINFWIDWLSRRVGACRLNAI
jgi:hypothetical protein